MLTPVRTVAPAVTPVSVAEAKANSRVDTSDDDTLIGVLIDAAVAHLDGYAGTLGRALVQQTWRQDVAAFIDPLRLPVGNVMAISSITYYDSSNALQTLSTDVYTAMSDERGSYVTLKPDQSWPSVYSRPDAVRVTWTAGYGANASDVPAAIRQAILLMVSSWYENRETTVIGTIVADLPMGSQALLAPYRRVGW